MSTRAFGIGVESFSKKLVDYINDGIKVMAVSLASADVANVAVTGGVTNASPMVVTSASHAYSNGDVVVGRGVGGNLAANGTFVIGGVTTNTFNLLNMDGSNTTGSAAYTSGGTFLNLTKAANLGDVNAGRVGTDQTLGSKTDVGGVLNCAAFSFTVSGTVDGFVVYKDGGSDAASIPLFWIDGKMQVTFASAKAATSTAVDVQRLAGPLANGVAATTSAGVLVTSNASAAQFARSVTVVSLPTGGVSAGDNMDVPTTGAGLPFTGSGGTYTITPDTAANKLFNLNAIA